MLALTSVEAFLAGLRDRWLARNELANIDPNEGNRIATDLGITAKDLETLVERGPDAANLLFRRMHALGLSAEDVESVARGLMRDLEKTCACCNEKGICEKDLSRRPEDPKWKGYCPNAGDLSDLLTRLKGRLPS
jgi:hypothetical protein